MVIALVVLSSVAGLGIGMTFAVWVLGRQLPMIAERLAAIVDQTVGSVSRSVAQAVRYPGGTEMPVQVQMPTEEMFAGVDREVLREPGPPWMYEVGDDEHEAVGQ